MTTATPPNAPSGQLDGEASRPDPTATGQVALRPRWLWVAFAVVALAVPAVGLWLERAP